MPRTTQPITHYRDLLYKFYEQQKRMPSYSELCTVFSVASKDTVHRIVQKLALSNMITIDATRRIIPITNNDKQKTDRSSFVTTSDEPSTTIHRFTSITQPSLFEHCLSPKLLLLIPSIQPIVHKCPPYFMTPSKSTLSQLSTVKSKEGIGVISQLNSGGRSSNRMIIQCVNYTSS